MLDHFNLPFHHALNKISNYSGIITKKLNTTLAVVSITGFLYLFFIAGRLVVHDYDISAFIDASHGITNQEEVFPNVIVSDGGFDGQYFYRLALNPFTNKKVDYGVDLVHPSYRHQRILYPLMVWLISFGKPEIVPYNLVLLNFCMVCIIGFIGSRIAEIKMVNRLWGLVFSLYPGLILSLCRDLSEITAVVFVLIGLLMIRTERFMCGTIAFTLAVLAKETTLIVAGGLGLSWLYGIIRKNKDKLSEVWYVWFFPALTYVGVQIAMWLNWGDIPMLSNPKQQFGLPLMGFLHRIIDAALFFNSSDLVHGIARLVWLTECTFLAAFTISILRVIRGLEAPQYEKISWVLYLGFASMMTWELWQSDQAFLRVTTEFYMIGMLLLLSSQSYIRKYLVIWIAIIWIPVAAARMKY